MSNSEVLCGDIFIIPNSLNICDGIYGYDVEDVTGLQVCFQGRITNEECSNWSDHYYDKFDKQSFSDKFPVVLFYGKREGDTAEMTIRGRKVIVTCKQLSYKYNEANFQNRLYDLTMSFGGTCSPSYYNPPLNKQSQYAMFIANHENYCRSMLLEKFTIMEPCKFRYSKNYIEMCKEETNKKPTLSYMEQLFN